METVVERVVEKSWGAMDLRFLNDIMLLTLGKRAR